MRTLDRTNVKFFKYACPVIGKETDVDISAKCVICGDSEKDSRQKRLHLYTKSSYDHDTVNCFNCGFHGSMYKFLKEVDSSLFEQYKREMRERSFNSLRDKKDRKEEFNARITLGTYKGKESRSGSEIPSRREDVGDGHEVKQSKYSVNFSQFNESGNGEHDDGSRRFHENEDQPINTSDEHKRNVGNGNSRTSVINGNDSDGSSESSISSGAVLQGTPRTEHVGYESPPDDSVTADLGKVPDGVFELPLEFIPASDSKDASDYLHGRGLNPEHYLYSPDKVIINEKYIPVKNCIIVPLWVLENERIVYGFQARSIESKFFYTYIPEMNTGFKVWNWYNIDKTKPTFIFESVFDADSSGLPRDRIVAALGADLNDERLSELHEPIFCLDNQLEDHTSKEKTEKLLKAGYRALVWDTTVPYKDANDCIKKGFFSKPEMAKYIITHLETGMRGIMRLKLKK